MARSVQGAVVVVVLAGVAVLAARCWRSQVLMHEDIDEVAKMGFPILEAIYQYKNVRGLWPLDFVELVDQYPELPARLGGELLPGSDSSPSSIGRWWYTWYGTGFALRTYAGHRLLVQYSVNSGVPHFTPGFESFHAPAGKRATEVPADSILTQLEKRIGREPRNLAHRHGKLALLLKLGRLREARDECVSTVAAFPHHWWPRLALADIEARMGAKEDAATKLASWAGEVGTFESSLVLFLLLHKYSDRGEEIPGLEDAIGRKPTPDVLLENGLESHHSGSLWDALCEVRASSGAVGASGRKALPAALGHVLWCEGYE